MTHPSWFLDESQLAGEEHLAATYVEQYDAKARFDPEPDLAILRELGFGPKSTLVDLGAGTGTLSLAAAATCHHVIAVDVSPAMLQAAHLKAEALGLTNIEFVLAGFLTYAHEGDLVDFVYTRNALHHLPDFWKSIALKRLATILKPGGVLRLRDIVFSCDLEDVEAVTEAWLGAAPDQPEEGWTKAQLEAHLRDEHSTYSWLLEPMLDRSGFEMVSATHSDSEVSAAYNCRRR
jgi:ubiquinone/menaquinone biosynthesis C-methylase UbiE